MIELSYMTVKGFCDTPEELQDYLECLSLLPARIVSWSIAPNLSQLSRLQLMEFRVDYQPLTK